MKRIFLTGGTGFIGRHLVTDLLADELDVIAGLRRPDAAIPFGRDVQTVQFDLGQADELAENALRDVECVFHLAAHVHVMKPGAHDVERFDLLNARATKLLAERAARAGVRRFVYLSSIKVNGEVTRAQPFAPGHTPNPDDAYGRSKLRAEEGLHEVSSRTGLEVAIVRPPLVYGPGVGGNFRRVLAMIYRGTPLPFASIDNRRSLVSVWNLVSLIRRVAVHPQAGSQTWMVSDGEDVSTPQLMRLLAIALDRRARLFPVPVLALKTLAVALGRRKEIDRLLNSLQVDTSATVARLDWRPLMTLEEGLRKTASWYRTAVRDAA